MKKFGIFAIMLVLAGSLAGCKCCGRTGNDGNLLPASDSTDTQEDTTETTEEETPVYQYSEEGDREFVFDQMNPEPWQKAFNEQIESANLHGSDYYDDCPAESYFIYDIDDDQIPELFIRFGTCEADYHLVGYKYQEDGKMIACGEMAAGHSSFYTNSETGMAVVWGHMGSMSIDKVYLNESGFLTENVIQQQLSDDGSDGFTPVTDLISGASYLNYISTSQTLPIIAYSNYIETSAHDDSLDLEKIFEEVYLNGADVYGVCDTLEKKLYSRISFKQFLTEGYADEYKTLAIAHAQYGDLNGDGQIECLLELKEDDQDYPGIIILSYQDGRVYAYYVPYFAKDSEIGFDSTIKVKDDDVILCYQAFFYRDQFYINLLD